MAGKTIFNTPTMKFTSRELVKKLREFLGDAADIAVEETTGFGELVIYINTSKRRMKDE